MQSANGEFMFVSMESGLEDRNNAENVNETNETASVSMESGLEDRNNRNTICRGKPASGRLNGVRPRRPEQYQR